MPLPRGLPVVDHHCHLSWKGDGVRAVERFRAAGGTHLFLATQNYEGTVPLSIEAYTRQFEATWELAEKVRKEVGVRAYPVLAPYPIDLVEASAKLGPRAASSSTAPPLTSPARYVREKRAVAESDRPLLTDIAAGEVKGRAVEVDGRTGSELRRRLHEVDGVRGEHRVGTHADLFAHLLRQLYGGLELASVRFEGERDGPFVVLGGEEQMRPSRGPEPFDRTDPVPLQRQVAVMVDDRETSWQGHPGSLRGRLSGGDPRPGAPS